MASGSPCTPARPDAMRGARLPPGQAYAGAGAAAAGAAGGAGSSNGGFAGVCEHHSLTGPRLWVLHLPAQQERMCARANCSHALPFDAAWLLICCGSSGTVPSPRALFSFQEQAGSSPHLTLPCGPVLFPARSSAAWRTSLMRCSRRWTRPSAAGQRWEGGRNLILVCSAALCFGQS